MMSWEDAVRQCMDDPAMSDLARDAYFMPPVEAAHSYHRSAEFSEVNKYLPAIKGRALDLGAGNGILSYALAAEGWEVTAVEPDSSSLVGADAIRHVSKDTGMPIEVIEAFGENIPTDKPYDLVVARQVLHHAQDLKAFCSEMARLSRPGATVMTLRDHVITDKRQLQAFLHSHPLHHLYGGENAFKVAEYRLALESSGIEIRRQWNSFQSVINFAPLNEDDVRVRIANYAGPLKSIVHAALEVLPFTVVANIASIADRRPGRLISFLGEKKGE